VNPVTLALTDARPACFWLDRPERPQPARSLAAEERADLAIVGGGFTGLWAALLAKEADAQRDVVLIEADAVAEGATGRNGGFIDASLTHGIANGLQHFPREIETLERLGRENYDDLLATLGRYAIDADYEGNGTLIVANVPYLEPMLREWAHELQRFDRHVQWLDRDALRSELESPTYHGGYWRRAGSGLVDPARLAWGLRSAAMRLGVRVYEHTPLTALRPLGAEMEISTPTGRIKAQQVVMATNAFRSPMRRMRRAVIPIWDYALVTEPLSPEQRARIGWANRQGVCDGGNRFHYYRLTSDDRILWGGYDAIYHFASGLRREHQQRAESHARLARQFFETFPQLEGIRFTHRWGGPIAGTTRFCLSAGSGFGGRVAWAIGYTGQGVGASRFGARAALEQLAGEGETLGLDLVRRAPIRWPPEPLRWLGVRLTQRALARADQCDGRRGPWLRLLDRLGLGFDS
jgi:glycine/D-amino acid oxidase-like deaminating enzyme